VEQDKQTGWPVRYWYDPEKRGGGPMLAPFNQPSKNALPFELDRIIHRTYAPDPSVPWWGLGPYSAALDAIEADVEITLYIKQFFKHGAVPPYMLLYEEDMTGEQERQIQTRWDKNVAGATESAWKIGVMGGGGKATLQRLGLAAGSREVGLQDLRDSTETRILVALNVPPIVVGVRLGIESMTYSNYGQARQAMHEENTDPLTRKRTSAFTAYYRRRTGNPLLRISNDLTDVLAVQDRLRERSEWATRELQGGVAMQNEARGKAGYPPTPNGDVFFIPLNLMPSDGSLITQDRVSELAAIHRDYEGTKRVLREQAFVSAQSMGLATVPETLLTHVLAEVTPKGENESKRQFATRVLMLTHTEVQSFAHQGGKWGTRS
jgi:phage portal protein BeeE